MKKYIFVATGGVLGTCLRYFIINLQVSDFPINTLRINLAGSLVLGFILTITLCAWKISEHLRLGITIGFLGAFTTFSTFCKETVTLFHSGDYLLGVLYITLSTALGLFAAFLGIKLAHRVTHKYRDNDESGAR